MGQDSSCGICGKHYQECRHRLKEHILVKGKTVCGIKKPKLTITLPIEISIDPDDVCERCKRIGSYSEYDFEEQIDNWYE